MVPFNVAYLGGGHFHKGVAGKLYADDLPATRALSEAVGNGPAALALSKDMVGMAWGKLLINLNNAVNALSGMPLLEHCSEHDYRRVVAASQREGLRLLKRAGIRPAKVGSAPPRFLPLAIGSPDWLFNNCLPQGVEDRCGARSSMADDLAARRKTEIDYINGELFALGRAAAGRIRPSTARSLRWCTGPKRAPNPGLPPRSGARCWAASGVASRDCFCRPARRRPPAFVHA